MISARFMFPSIATLTALSRLGCSSHFFFKPRIVKIEDLDETSKQLMDILYCPDGFFKNIGFFGSSEHIIDFVTLAKEDITNALSKSQKERIELLKILVVLRIFYHIKPVKWNEIQEQVSKATTIHEKRMILSLYINAPAFFMHQSIFQLVVKDLGKHDFSNLLIKILLELKVNPDALENECRETPALHHCVMRWQYENADLLLQAGADIDARDFNERTALTSLCHQFTRQGVLVNKEKANNIKRLLRKLFEFSPNPFLTDKHGYTASEYITSESRFSMMHDFISMLIDYEKEYTKRKVAVITAEYTLPNLGPIISDYSEGERDGSTIRRKPN